MKTIITIKAVKMCQTFETSMEFENKEAIYSYLNHLRKFGGPMLVNTDQGFTLISEDIVRESIVSIKIKDESQTSYSGKPESDQTTAQEEKKEPQGPDVPCPRFLSDDPLYHTDTSKLFDNVLRKLYAKIADSVDNTRYT